ncbi:hypothetical protein JTB14_024581 [Gonioctena quinquepunctata]|nr:hypothetical protein JTB14_024581 [Gonioctena quinquepunctata]
MSLQQIMKFPLHTNCMGSYRYDEGKIVKEDKKKTCISTPEGNTTNIRVLGDTSGIDTEIIVGHISGIIIIDYQPPRESSTDSSSWD